MIYLVRYGLIVLYTVLWGSLGVLVTLVDRSGRGILFVARTWIDWILATCGVEVEAQGLENVTDNEPCILMSNHQSVFDIAALIHVLPVQWKFVAKKELIWIPFFGWALGLADQIVVDRSNREKAVRSLDRAVQRIRAGTNVIIYPEGTRSRDAQLKAPEQFKSGGFHLAIGAGVPIVPVTVSGSQRISPKRSLRVESGRIRIRFGRPIPTQELGLDDRHALKQRVRDAIYAGFDWELQDAAAGAAAQPEAPGLA